MLNRARAMVGRRLLFALACLGAFVAASGTARAQITGSSSGTSSIGSGSESITSPIPNPYRYLTQNGVAVNVTNTPRPQNLNPTGVNFSDCEQDLRLDFPLVLSGFQPSDYAHVEVWAGTVDCTQDANRNNINAGVSQPCWKVAGELGPQNAVSPYSLPSPISIYVRDVLRYEVPITTTGQNLGWDPNFHNGPNGEDACFVQTSDAGVQLNVYFIPVQSTEQAIGTAYQYPLNTDLVAPPPPYNVTLNAGDSLLQANWTTPGNDPDIVGFAVFADPPGASESTGSCSCGNSVGSGANSYVGDGALIVPGEEGGACMDAESDATEADASGGIEASTMDASGSGGEAGTGSPEASVSDASPESGLPDAAGVADAAAGEAGAVGTCTPNGITVGGAEGGSCFSAALENNRFVVGGGSSSVPITTINDAGESVGGDAGEALTGGGISSINPKYEVGEIDDFTATQMTLTGLTNGDPYTVVVTSIDGSGNIGPTSVAACGTPKPTNDYWKTYKKDDGGASGCALESGDGSNGQVPLFALGLAAAAAAFIRRRTRR